MIGDASRKADSKADSWPGLTLSMAASRIIRLLRRSDLRGLMEAQFLDGDLAHLVLLDLARHCHGEIAHKLDVTWDLIVCDLAAAEVADLLGAGGLALLQLDP